MYMQNYHANNSKISCSQGHSLLHIFRSPMAQLFLFYISLHRKMSGIFEHVDSMCNFFLIPLSLWTPEF